jgi:hypothetical protein
MLALIGLSSWVLTLAIGFQDANDPPRFRANSVIKTTTGRNGFEEVMQACELADDPSLRRLRAWCRNLLDLEIGLQESRQDAETRASVGISPKATPEVATFMIEKHRPILDLLDRAITKPMHDPRAMDMSLETLFPDFAIQKDLVRLQTIQAWIHSANGRPRLSAQALVNAMIGAEASADSALIGQLVWIAKLAVVLARVEPHSAGYGIEEWRLLERTARSLLAREPSLIRALQSEVSMMLRQLAPPGKSAKEAFINYLVEGGEIEEDSASARFLKNLPNDSAERIRKAVVDQVLAKQEAMITLLSGPESEWIKSSGTIETDDEERLDSQIRDVNDLTRTLSDYATPFYGNAIVAVARIRTQLRLLILHARIEHYRLHHNRLPGKLTDAVEAADLLDPFSGEPFQYQLKDSGTYRVYSKGFASTGEIELRYRRRVSEDSGPGDLPPTKTHR